MDQDTKDFLATLLWLSDAPDAEEAARLQAASVEDFSPAFIAAVEAFIAGFREHLAKSGFDMSALDKAGRSFGGNVYLSLSGHGAGFFDDRDEEIAALHETIKTWAGGWRFEELGYSLTFEEDGKIDLAVLPEYVDKARARMFAVPQTEEKKEEVAK